MAGLRREEVAVLVGMNSDYYARLEQGRERSPSSQILESISSALRMDDEARRHMFRLAGIAPEVVEEALREYLDGITDKPIPEGAALNRGRRPSPDE